MREGLSTVTAAKWPGRGLSRPIFSGPHDCANLVFSLYHSDFKVGKTSSKVHFDPSSIRPIAAGAELSFKYQKGWLLFIPTHTGVPGRGVILTLARAKWSLA